MREDDPSSGLRRIGDPLQLLHEIGVRKPVEPIATDAEPQYLRGIATIWAVLDIVR